MSEPKPLRAKLYAVIFLQCKALHLDEAGRRDATEAVIGKRSLKQCTEKELSKIIDDFKERGAVLEKPKAKRGSRRPVNGAPGSVARMITPDQRRTIEKLMNWNNLSEDDVRSISYRICKSAFPRTTRGATALILALSKTKRKEPSYDSLPSSP